jgi:hypothetical protein
MRVTTNETSSRTRTHLRGRDVGVKPCQMRPLSNMLIETETDVTAKARRNSSAARVALFMRNYGTHSANCRDQAITRFDCWSLSDMAMFRQSLRTATAHQS